MLTPERGEYIHTQPTLLAELHRRINSTLDRHGAIEADNTTWYEEGRILTLSG